jgi:hypothetical protein
MAKCASIIYKDEGFWGFYKSLGAIWGRQIPYTMMKVNENANFLPTNNDLFMNSIRFTGKK